MRSIVTTQRTRDADIHSVAYSDRLVRLVQLPGEMLTSLTRRASHSPASQETAFPRSLDTWHRVDAASGRHFWRMGGCPGEARVFLPL